MTLYNYPEKLIGLTKFWSPPVGDWQPILSNKRSTLRIACVLEDRLYQGMKFECELLLLTPDNWRDVITHGKPDILLMESIWRSATGHWYLGQYPKETPDRQELLAIIQMAKDHGIPTVFWITKGHEYHSHYNTFAPYFDATFCADPREVDLLRGEGVQADPLLPCTQPALFNPFRKYDDYHAISIAFLFDGWADVDRLSTNLKPLESIRSMGLAIIESHYHLFQRRAALLDQFKDCVLGCVTQNGKIAALKYSNCMVTFDHSLPSTTTRQWDALDALASQLPILHLGTLSDDDIRKHLIVTCSDENQFIQNCEWVATDDMYRKTTAHLGWRAVYQHHTFAHRLKTICTTLGITHGWDEFPKASLICPTYRESFIGHLIDTFNRQDYPEKELIVVFNGDHSRAEQARIAVEKQNATFCTVPKELFAGACLNLGYINATGDYCFRIDDDDLYGDHYLSDMMLYLRAVDANIFGKPPSGLRFSGEAHAYVRDNQYCNCILKHEHIQSRKVWIGGNTMASKRNTHLQHPYKDRCYGAADTDYQLNSNETAFILMDNFNVVAERRDDQATHTWKIDEEQIKANSKLSVSDLLI